MIVVSLDHNAVSKGELLLLISGADYKVVETLHGQMTMDVYKRTAFALHESFQPSRRNLPYRILYPYRAFLFPYHIHYPYSTFAVSSHADWPSGLSIFHRTAPIIMRTFQAFASILLYTASALGDAAPGPIPASPSTAATPTAVVKGHDPADLPALYTPPPGPMPDAAQLSGDVTIGITNQLVGTPVITIVGAHDANALGARTPVNGQFTQTTNIVVPSGWAGAFTVDKVGAPFNTLGSRFEGNWGVNDPANLVYIDVSYVTGFSVAMVCSCGNDPHATPVTGCNKNLYDLNSCPTGQSQGNSASPVCVNDSGTNGPPQAFFAPVSKFLV